MLRRCGGEVNVVSERVRPVGRISATCYLTGGAPSRGKGTSSRGCCSNSLAAGPLARGKGHLARDTGPGNNPKGVERIRLPVTVPVAVRAAVGCYATSKPHIACLQVAANLRCNKEKNGFNKEWRDDGGAD